MNEFQVTCIRKLHPQSPHEHITHIGNASLGWMLTRESAIARIESKTEAYYTVDTGNKAYVGVVREPGKAPYLRTYAVCYWNNNLLSLGQCVTACSIVA